MADFKTHLTVASIASSIAATMLFAATVATPQEVLLYFVLGVVGGLLPDIDSDSFFNGPVAVYIYCNSDILFSHVQAAGR